jgi:hypothetical protein
MSVGQNLFGRGLHLYIFSGNNCLGEAYTVTLTNNPVCVWDGVLIWRSFMIVSPPSTPTRAIGIFGFLSGTGDGEGTTVNEWAELDLVPHVTGGGNGGSNSIGFCDAIEGQELPQPDTGHWDDFPREWHFKHAIHGMTSCTYTNNAAPARGTGTLSCPGLTVSCPPVSGTSIGICISGSVNIPDFFPVVGGIVIGGGVGTFELLTICEW